MPISFALPAWNRESFARDRAPFLTAVLVGLAAHGYAFTNKLVNHDEIESLFGKGATVTSGRWGLELVKLLFPDWSMPWIYGLVSLVMIAAAVCLMLRTVELKSRALRLLTAALVVSFPSLTGNFCFMFTSAPYAWAFLLSVLGAWLIRGGKRLAAVPALVLALGIYQAYIAVAAGLLVLVMIADALDGEKSVDRILRFGVAALATLLLAVALYYGVTLLVLRLSGESFNSYVTDNVSASLSLPRRVRVAYDNFFYVFSFRNFSLISSESARRAHIALALLTLGGMGFLAWRAKKPLHAALLAVLTALLPLAICCMFLIMSQQSVHTLVLYGFVAVYLLAALVAERIPLPRAAAEKLCALLLAFFVAGNVYFANKVYLKLQLQYENAYAFYTVLAARVTGTEGFDADCRLALIGRQDNLLHSFPELDTELMQGVNPELINIYSRENFLRYYLGLDLPFADGQTLAELEADPRVEAMAEYPYDGSVRRIGDCIVVKLG